MLSTENRQKRSFRHSSFVILSSLGISSFVISPHRLALLLACATFPLIWIGGLVTSTDAGMAVPDWPTTYGYNLFLYPWRTWFFGPWDLFVEHGHRLLGALVGLLTIALGVSLWLRDKRRWMHWLAGVALAAVIIQGTIGGMRVLLDQRLLALVHGCVGPAFFALCVAMAVLTSGAWQIQCREGEAQWDVEAEWEGEAPAEPRPCKRPWMGEAPAAPRLFRGPDSAGASSSQQPVAFATSSACTPHDLRLAPLALLTTGATYLQVVLGALARHMPPVAEPSLFRVAVVFHLILGAVLIALAVALLVQVLRSLHVSTELSRAVYLLGVFVLAQVALGGATWVVQYGWPAWLADYSWAAGYTVRSGGLLQTHVVTAHAALGSLILGTSLMATLLCWRRRANAQSKAEQRRPLTSGEPMVIQSC